MIERKLKECIQCKQQKYLFAHGRCAYCSSLVKKTVNKLKKKERSETISSLKKKLDAVFSLWIRNRGSKDGMNTCVCCGLVKPIKELQCAHYFSRRYLAVRWDELNAQPNCMRCNVLLHGNYPEYVKYMIDTYGMETIEKLRIKKDNTVKMTKEDYKLLIRKYELH